MSAPAETRRTPSKADTGSGYFGLWGRARRAKPDDCAPSRVINTTSEPVLVQPFKIQLHLAQSGASHPSPSSPMEPTYQLLVDRVIHRWSEKPHDRILIALAGPPGSGKTTLAREVAQRLASSSPAAPKTSVVSIDGFHLTLAALRALPNAEEALARRGAPWTFDAEAAATLVRELRTSGPSSSGALPPRDVVVPTFDHAVKDPVAGGLVVRADVQVCILEGNYLLSDEGPWAAIADLVDDRWLVKVDRAVARARVAARHLAAGIEPTMEMALARTDYNDLPNGDYVMRRSEGRYDLLVQSVDQHVGA